MQVASLSTAMAAVGAACAKPHQKIVPFVRRPEEVTPGNALHFATAYGARRLRQRPAGREPRGPPDQDRGQPRAPADAGRDHARSSRAWSSASTTTIAPSSSASGTRPLAWRTFLAEAAVRANQLAEDARRRPALPDRADDVAAAGRSAPPDPRALPERQVRQLRVAGRRRRGRRRQAGVRQAAGAAPQGRAGQRDPVAGRRLPGRGHRADAAVARVRGPPRAEPRR